ncbi:MAG TPA: gamma-glutamylcyclotransferase family protein [Polyangiaceae bacterium]|nr:gamma-glutamylcyclotransferase family protein [Polyangiaceae bacterium]
MTVAKTCRMFFYGTMLPGERDHAFLANAELIGPAVTEAQYQLVELNVYAALVPDGKVAVHGELYAVDLETRRKLDVSRQVPILFQRTMIRLADGSDVETYSMTTDQVRGKRRLGHGDWRKRFAPTSDRQAPGQLVSWARNRFEK